MVMGRVVMIDAMVVAIDGCEDGLDGFTRKRTHVHQNLAKMPQHRRSRLVLDLHTWPM